MIPLKAWLKRAVNTLPANKAQRRERRVVLCYHSIDARKQFASASPRLFRDHLDWLTRHCQVVPFSTVLSARAIPARARPVVAITFDDGYEDNYTHALPLLTEYGVPATFFLTCGLLEKDDSVLSRFRALRGQCAEPDIRPLSWAQVREMRKAGMEFGCHTWSHPNLGRLHPHQVRAELSRSKSVIEHQLGEQVRLFAYPFGKPRRHFTGTTRDIVAQLGYARAAAVSFRAVNERDDPLAIPRFFVTNDDVDTLAAKVGGAWDWLGVWHEHGPLWMARLVSPADFNV